jgi:hypothetical protein
MALLVLLERVVLVVPLQLVVAAVEAEGVVEAEVVREQMEQLVRIL